MTYGAIEGSDRLRNAIAALCERQGRENVLVTHSTIGANFLVHQALVGQGDRMVAVVPTYQQHTSIPRALGRTSSSSICGRRAAICPTLPSFEPSPLQGRAYRKTRSGDAKFRVVLTMGDLSDAYQ